MDEKALRPGTVNGRRKRRGRLDTLRRPIQLQADHPDIRRLMAEVFHFLRPVSALQEEPLRGAYSSNIAANALPVSLTLGLQ